MPSLSDSNFYTNPDIFVLNQIFLGEESYTNVLQ